MECCCIVPYGLLEIENVWDNMAKICSHKCLYFYHFWNIFSVYHGLCGHLEYIYDMVTQLNAKTTLKLRMCLPMLKHWCLILYTYLSEVFVKCWTLRPLGLTCMIHRYECTSNSYMLISTGSWYPYWILYVAWWKLHSQP